MGGSLASLMIGFFAIMEPSFRGRQRLGEKRVRLHPMWLFLFFVLPTAVGIGSVTLVYLAQTIAKRNRGRCYDDVHQIPANRVGLILGCARELNSGRPNLYFEYRIDAAAALFRAGKVERLLASGASHRADEDEAAHRRRIDAEAQRDVVAEIRQHQPRHCNGAGPGRGGPGRAGAADGPDIHHIVRCRRFDHRLLPTRLKPQTRMGLRT